MTHHSSGADRIGHEEASLGDAQSHNPPDDPDMLTPDAADIDTDTEYEGEGQPPEDERGNEDYSPNAP